MAWNPSAKIADCRTIAQKWNCEMVLITGINRNGQMTTATYGKDVHLCRVAKRYGDAAHDAIMKRAEQEAASSDG